ncbi:peptide-aspartate beta-dioxygenase [Aureococcus anophagefferens]|nr:peptide-aspartate beta-dioxygenase [Aureococcus anophagefferens]
MVKPRILSAWTPSKRRVREDLEMHLEEAEQQLEQQRREGERLRRVKDAFDASLELRSRELELALEDVNRCKRSRSVGGGVIDDEPCLDPSQLTAGAGRVPDAPDGASEDGLDEELDLYEDAPAPYGTMAAAAEPPPRAGAAGPARARRPAAEARVYRRNRGLVAAELASERAKTERLAVVARERKRREARDERDVRTWEELERERLDEIKRLKRQLREERTRTRRQRRTERRQAELDEDFARLTGAASTLRRSPRRRDRGDNSQASRPKAPATLEVVPSGSSVDLHGLARSILAESAARSAAVGKGEELLFRAVVWDDYRVVRDRLFLDLRCPADRHEVVADLVEIMFAADVASARCADGAAGDGDEPAPSPRARASGGGGATAPCSFELLLHEGADCGDVARAIDASAALAHVAWRASYDVAGDRRGGKRERHPQLQRLRSRPFSARDWLVIHAKNAPSRKEVLAELQRLFPSGRRGSALVAAVAAVARDADEPAGATLPWGASPPAPRPAPAPAPRVPDPAPPRSDPPPPRSDPPPPSRATVGPIAEIPPFRGGAPADEPAPSRPPPTTKLAEIPPFRPRDEPPIHEEENVEEPGVDEDVDADRCTYHVKFRPGADPYEVAAKLFAVAAVADAGVVWDPGSVVANAGDNRFLVTCTLPEDVSRDFMYRELQRNLVPLSGRSMGLVTFVDLAYDWDEPDPAKEIVTLDAAKLAALVDREQREPSAQLGASRGSDASDDFGARLARAGLGSVAEGLRAEGVDDLQTLAKMTEAEVDALARDLGLKVGFAVKLKGLRAEAVARKRLSQAPSRHSVMSQFDLEPLAPGARVLARHGDDAFFSEGAVEAVDGESYGVRFDFGAVGDDIPRRRIFTANQVQDAALPVGETVDALVDGEDDARVATATVVAVDGDAYHVVFEDPELGEASLTRDQVWGAFHDRPAVDPAALLLDDPPSPLKMSPRDDPAAEEPDEPEEPEEPDAEEDPEPAEAPPRPGDLVAVPAASPSRPRPRPRPRKRPGGAGAGARAGRPAVAAEAAAARRRRGAALGARARRGRRRAPSAVLADWGVIAPDDDVAVRAEATTGGLALVAEASVAGFPWAWLDEQLQDRFAEFPDVLKSLALQPADQSPRDKSPRRGGAVSAPTRALSPRADNSPRRDAVVPDAAPAEPPAAEKENAPEPDATPRRDAVVSAPTRALSPRADNSPRRDAVVPDAAPAEPPARPEKENARSPAARGARRVSASAVAARRQLAAARRARARREPPRPRRAPTARRAATPCCRATPPSAPRSRDRARRRGGAGARAAPADYLAPGARVECRYMATSEFYGGVVASYVNGRYTVEYDDMGTEHGVDRLRLRLPGQAMAPPAVDAVVDAWHPGSNCVRRASVVGLGAERVTVKFDDDGVVHDVGRGSLFGVPAPGLVPSPRRRRRRARAAPTRSPAAPDGPLSPSFREAAPPRPCASATPASAATSTRPSHGRRPRALGETVDAACAARDGAVLPGMVVEVYKGGNYKVNFDDADLDEVVLPRDAIFSGFYGDAAEPAADAEPAAPAEPAEPEPAAPTPIAFSGSAADMLKSMGAAVCTDEHCTEDHAHGHDHGDGEVCTEDHGHGGHDHGGDHASHDHASHDHASHDHDSHDHDHHEEEPAHAHDHHEEDSGHKHDEPAHAHDHHKEEPAHAHDHHEEEHEHEEEPAHAHDDDAVHAHDDDDEPEPTVVRPAQPALAPGTRVMCRYGNDAEFYAGVVDGGGGGAYSVAYDDGDVETAVARRRLYVPGQVQAEALEVGETVDAVCDARDGDVLPATVASRFDDGTYEVAFDFGPGAVVPRSKIFGEFHDPERAASPRPKMATPVKALAARAPDVVEPVEGPDAPASPDVVEDVEKPGVDDALAVGRRNNYETPKGEALTFDNDDFSPKKAKKPVLHDHHAKQAAPPSPKVAEARGLAARGAEDAVLARYGEERTFYPAVVTGVHARSYAILFDDGDRDDDARGGGSSSGPAPGDRGRDDVFGPFVDDRDAAPVGTVCDCREAEGGAYAPCTVTAVDAATGSHTVWHADARREEAGVSRRRLRLRGMVPPSRLDVGEEVDAWRSTTGSVVAGVIVCAHANGSYTQDAEFYPATVVRDNGDGTYAVLFDDGDEDDAANRRAIYRPGQQQHQILADLGGDRYAVRFDAGSGSPRGPEELPRTQIFSDFYDVPAPLLTAPPPDIQIDVPAAASPRSLESHEHHLMASDADHPTSPHAGAFDDVDKQSHISSAAFSEHGAHGGFDRGEDHVSEPSRDDDDDGDEGDDDDGEF